MASRMAARLVTLILVGVLVFGLLLVRYAQDMPAPGALLIAVSVAALLYRFMGQRRPTGADHEDTAFAGSDSARESSEYDAERRRRGDSDASETDRPGRSYE
jgi:hypothetical protein